MQSIHEFKKQKKQEKKHLTNLSENLKCCLHFFTLLFPLSIFFFLTFVADPKFSGPILNATVAVGRDAVLTCMVEDLSAYKVSLLCKLIAVKVQTVLSGLYGF